MGDTYKVEVYKQLEDESYGYIVVYRGESYRDAIKVMRINARDGIKCIKMEWRPLNYAINRRKQNA